jgi:DNA-binding response OmpR family regulator
MKKILVIEDNNEMRENICETLELAGYDVSEAINGKDGVTKAKELLPDLIVCDVMMPELEGYGVLKILSKEESTKHIPFIFLTAKSEKIDYRKGMLLGADDYITKPFEEDELLSAIEVRLNKYDNLLTQSKHSPITFNDLIANGRTIKYKKKELVYKENAYNDNIYFLQKGNIKIYKSNELGKEFIVEIVSEGNFFGYHSIIEESTNSDSAEAIENCVVILIEKNAFLDYILWNKNNAEEFLVKLTDKIKDKEEKLLSLAYNSVRKRTALVLLELLDKFKPANNELIITRDNLANLIGTATETCIRTLADLQNSNIIEMSGSKIKILDKDKLIKIRV